MRIFLKENKFVAPNTELGPQFLATIEYIHGCSTNLSFSFKVILSMVC
jgi:hypothetical protein